MRKVILIYLLISSAVANGQDTLARKFVDEGMNEATYIKFKPDLTFEYGYHIGVINDDAVGRYKLLGYTMIVLFDYKTIIDTIANHYNSNEARPDTLILKGHKLYLYEKGHVFNKRRRTQVAFKPPRSWGYRRKYFLFGPYVSKRYEEHYMTDVRFVKWVK